MNILEIAKKCGAETHNIGKREGYLNQLRITFDKSQLEALAAAVIEEYKDKCLYLADVNSLGNISFHTLSSQQAKEKSGTKLYALPVGESK